MPDRDWWEVLWPAPKVTVQGLGVTSGMTVLDLCCGDGYFTAPLAKIVSGKAYALDLDPLMIEQAKIEVGQQGTSILNWICADARNAARLIAEPLDYVLMANTFHGVPDQSGLVEAVRTMLKPRGLFGIINWHPVPREQTIVLERPRGPKTEMRMSAEQVKTIVEPGGFRLVKIVELPPYHYGAVFERLV
ncbi:class I SAM-dependent methyltransferase [Phyllobacterium sp. NPDC097923]|uniref:class I SAM-dependent methyltransferase n=1 Tax=Phyllobacterium sp. NPDC097923 TaxID=3364404 RepID=UPI00383BBC1D